MTKTIQLAKPYNKDKLGEALYVSEKLDGVPVVVTARRQNGLWDIDSVKSRQDEDVPSVRFNVNRLLKVLTRRQLTLPQSYDTTWKFVFETTHESLKDFKDVSGVVRRQEPQAGLILNAFDFYAESMGPDAPFSRREYAMRMILNKSVCHELRIIRQVACFKQDIDFVLKEEMKTAGEGLVVRDANDKWQPGKRTWGYQKVVGRPTIDLYIVGSEEGKGKNAGAVGRLIASYKGGTIGIGPGKLSYKERKELMSHHFGTHPRMACIQYKEDASYEALREPTFQHWRDDKKEADA